MATLASLAGSLVVDELVVAAGTRLFPSTEGYVHFRFSDYGKLTIIGVVVACLAWPVTARISSAPRWLFLRMAVLVTLVLWLPDLWILLRGQSPQAVAVLMVMHLAIALVTYNLVVRLAPVRAPVSEGDAGRDASSPRERPDEGSPTDPGLPSPLGGRRAGIAMTGLVVLELALGIGALVVVPYTRPSALVPSQGRLVYTIHAGLGGHARARRRGAVPGGTSGPAPGPPRVGDGLGRGGDRRRWGSGQHGSPDPTARCRSHARRDRGRRLRLPRHDRRNHLTRSARKPGTFRWPHRCAH